MEAQGYSPRETIVYQDNKSAMLLEKNEKFSSSKIMKHMNVRYFFIMDRIKNKEVSLGYCETELMIVDYFTKPLKWKKFMDFRKVIMNLWTSYLVKAMLHHGNVMGNVSKIMFIFIVCFYAVETLTVS